VAAAAAGLLRCGKSCRLRWTNYLRPDLKRGLLSDDEERLVIDLHAQLGNRCVLRDSSWFFCPSNGFGGLVSTADYWSSVSTRLAVVTA
jgi:hypothetical protein